jgi:L-lysine 6-transaminase
VRNLARSSKFGINVDFKKSHGSYLFDKNSNKKFLDLFGMYASLPLGYNHSIFKTQEFLNEYIGAASFKMNNCEFVSDETLEFDKMFVDFSGLGVYKNFHYCCTGALAIEAAIKTCIEYKGHKNPQILSFVNSFHGINSYGGFVTSRFPGADARLVGFPEIFSVKVNYDLDKVEKIIKDKEITCVLVEPIQCSAGDIHHNKEFYQNLNKICTAHDVPLIFDEIQIGFGGTGKLWYFQHLNFKPDIVVFGKKTQLSGIMVKEEFNSIFAPEKGIKLEVTWDGNVSDMIRCKYIMKAYEENNILENVNAQSERIIQGLEQLNIVKNLRNCGLIIGFDLKSNKFRDTIIGELFDNGLLCNSTGTRSIRLRPNLAITNQEVDSMLEIFCSIDKKWS